MNEWMKTYVFACLNFLLLLTVVGTRCWRCIRTSFYTSTTRESTSWTRFSTYRVSELPLCPIETNTTCITLYSHGHGANENAGVENAIRSKMQGWKIQEWKKWGSRQQNWKMQEWKNREQTARVENTGVGKPYRKPNRYYTLRDL